MTTREEAAREYNIKSTPLSYLTFNAFLAGCKHEAEKYKKLVEWAKRLQANRTFSAVAKVELDQILKELD